MLDIEIVRVPCNVKRQMPEAVRVFIAPPSWKELERRLVERGH